MHQPLHPALEPKPVDEYEFRIRHLLRIRRRRHIDMCIAVGADQRGDIDAIAADIADEIAEDREAGDDVEPILRPRRTADGD